MQNRAALVIVDVQKDFCAGGALEVADSESLIAPLNQVIEWATNNNYVIVFTRDWHPANHHSFREHGGPWPTHCVQDTPGAEFHPGLYIPDGSAVVDAGADPEKLGYSPYEDSQMETLICCDEIDTVFVVGIALEYCVRATCLDTAECGKKVVAIEPLIRSISSDPGALNMQWRELECAGVVRSKSIGPLESA